MNKDDATFLLFNIAKEVKRSFESPVILFTRKDYAEKILNILVEMRTALILNSAPEKVAEIVSSFHNEWLEAIEDIEKFKKRVCDTPRESITRAIEFTIECVKRRQENFQRFIDSLHMSMTSEEKTIIKGDIDIITDMRDIVNYALAEKQKTLYFQSDQADVYVLILNEIEELMNWLDKLNNCLAIQLSKILDFKIHLSPKNLTKTLQQVIDEVSNCPISQAKTIAHEIAAKGNKLSSAIRISSLNEIEITKIVEKIKHLENRINRLKVERSSAVVALEHKALYLEDRLRSLENLKLSLISLKNQQVLCVEEDINKEANINEEAYNIFNHLLPVHERRKLVDELVKLWKTAIVGHFSDVKSIISILSISDIKEVFSDEIGQFSVDKHGRKIYSLKGDDTMYQLNERNELVPVENDDDHVYFYDECGRYYLNRRGERIYKAHHCASEYMLHKAGTVMMKFSEEVEGMTYYYDHLGRYYLDRNNNRIYREKNDSDKYIYDGLGNLVRIRDEWPNYIYDQCPSEPIVLEESLYLKEAVGDALKKCLAQVLMAQPENPIGFLANCLEQYQHSEEDRQNKLKEESLLNIARDNLTPELSSLEQDLSTIQDETLEVDTDLNFVKSTIEL